MTRARAARSVGAQAAQRTARAGRRRDPSIDWWLQDGPEQCGFCLARFHYEEQYRCEACDAPICPFCAHEVRMERVSCPDCRGRGEGEG